jgi:hypothetical protein
MNINDVLFARSEDRKSVHLLLSYVQYIHDVQSIGNSDSHMGKLGKTLYPSAVVKYA